MSFARSPARRAVIPAVVLLPLLAVAGSDPLPRSWIDKDTGHRIIRLTDEPGSSGLYFNVNAFTPDGRAMVYTAPDGIHVLDLASRRTRLLVPNPPRPADQGQGPGQSQGQGQGRPPGFGVHVVAAGSRTNSVFFTELDHEAGQSVLLKADVSSGQVTRLVTLPPRSSVATINADETLAVGTYNENETPEEREYGHNLPRPAPGRAPAEGQRGSLVQPEGKGEMMERRLAARTPVVLYAINLANGKVTQLLHSTDWIGHMLFSPVDPTLLMYCHEGPWQKVDRIWMIRTDGTGNTLIHRRTMAMEIAGHEFWGLDGRSIWYDWQYPKGEDFFLAGYDLDTRRRVAYHLQRNEWSIHFNLTRDASLFAGDGGDPGQVAKAPDGEWIELFRPRLLPVAPGALDEAGFWRPGVFRSERLVNMAHHNYRLEPNVRFSPDGRLVIFTSNMFGRSYLFAAEVEKPVDPAPGEVHSTPDLARSLNPDEPAPTH